MGNYIDATLRLGVDLNTTQAKTKLNELFTSKAGGGLGDVDLAQVKELVSSLERLQASTKGAVDSELNNIERTTRGLNEAIRKFATSPELRKTYEAVPQFRKAVQEQLPLYAIPGRHTNTALRMATEGVLRDAYLPIRTTDPYIKSRQQRNQELFGPESYIFGGKSFEAYRTPIAGNRDALPVSLAAYKQQSTELEKQNALLRQALTLRREVAAATERQALAERKAAEALAASFAKYRGGGTGSFMPPGSPLTGRIRSTSSSMLGVTEREEGSVRIPGTSLWSRLGFEGFGGGGGSSRGGYGGSGNDFNSPYGQFGRAVGRVSSSLGGYAVYGGLGLASVAGATASFVKDTIEAESNLEKTKYAIAGMLNQYVQFKNAQGQAVSNAENLNTAIEKSGVLYAQLYKAANKYGVNVNDEALIFKQSAPALIARGFSPTTALNISAEAAAAGNLFGLQDNNIRMSLLGFARGQVNSRSPLLGDLGITGPELKATKESGGADALSVLWEKKLAGFKPAMEAYANSVVGELPRLANVFTQTAQTIGAVMAPIIIPQLTNFGNAVQKMVASGQMQAFTKELGDFVASFISTLSKLVGFVGPIVSHIDTLMNVVLVGGLTKFGAALMGLSGPVSLAIGAIGALITALVEKYYEAEEAAGKSLTDVNKPITAEERQAAKGVLTQQLASQMREGMPLDLSTDASLVYAGTKDRIVAYKAIKPFADAYKKEFGEEPDPAAIRSVLGTQGPGDRVMGEIYEFFNAKDKNSAVKEFVNKWIKGNMNVPSRDTRSYAYAQSSFLNMLGLYANSSLTGEEVTESRTAEVQQSVSGDVIKNAVSVFQDFAKSKKATVPGLAGLNGAASIGEYRRLYNAFIKKYPQYQADLADKIGIGDIGIKNQAGPDTAPKSSSNGLSLEAETPIEKAQFAYAAMKHERYKDLMTSMEDTYKVGGSYVKPGMALTDYKSTLLEAFGKYREEMVDVAKGKGVGGTDEAEAHYQEALDKAATALDKQLETIDKAITLEQQRHQEMQTSIELLKQESAIKRQEFEISKINPYAPGAFLKGLNMTLGLGPLGQANVTAKSAADYAKEVTNPLQAEAIRRMTTAQKLAMYGGDASGLSFVPSLSALDGIPKSWAGPAASAEAWNSRYIAAQKKQQADDANDPDAKKELHTRTYSVASGGSYTDHWGTVHSGENSKSMSGSNNRGLDPDFYKRLQSLIKASGGRVSLGSAYRSVAEQAELYRRYQAGGHIAAPPGASWHNHTLNGMPDALADDLHFSNAAAKQWAYANVGKYGLGFPLGARDPNHVQPLETFGKHASSGAVLGSYKSWPHEKDLIDPYSAPAPANIHPHFLGGLPDNESITDQYSDAASLLAQKGSDANQDFQQQQYNRVIDYIKGKFSDSYENRAILGNYAYKTSMIGAASDFSGLTALTARNRRNESQGQLQYQSWLTDSAAKVASGQMSQEDFTKQALARSTGIESVKLANAKEEEQLKRNYELQQKLAEATDKAANNLLKLGDERFGKQLERLTNPEGAVKGLTSLSTYSSNLENNRQKQYDLIDDNIAILKYQDAAAGHPRPDSVYQSMAIAQKRAFSATQQATALPQFASMAAKFPYTDTLSNIWTTASETGYNWLTQRGSFMRALPQMFSPLIQAQQGRAAQSFGLFGAGTGGKPTQMQLSEWAGDPVMSQYLKYAQMPGMFGMSGFKIPIGADLNKMTTAGFFGGRTKMADGSYSYQPGIVGSVGGEMVGDMLGASLFPHKSPQDIGIGQQIGSSLLGPTIAKSLGGSLGAFAGPLGAIGGSIIGSLLGGLFGSHKDDPNADRLRALQEKHQSDMVDVLNRIDKGLRPAYDVFRTIKGQALYGVSSAWFSDRGYARLGIGASLAGR